MAVAMRVQPAPDSARVAPDPEPIPGGRREKGPTLAADVEMGRITQSDTLAKVKWCLWCLGNPPWSCLRP